jgi:uncharacterized ion transporter superfamily protein YfcC
VQCGVDEAELLPNAEFMYVVSTILMGAMGYDSINVPSIIIISSLFGFFLFLFSPFRNLFVVDVQNILGREEQRQRHQA